MMDAIRGLGIFEHFHEGGPVQMWLKGLGLHRSHVVDLFGRLAFVFTLTGAGREAITPRTGRVSTSSERTSVAQLGPYSKRAVWPPGNSQGFCFVSVVEQGFRVATWKNSVERASIEGQLIGLQGWDFG